MWNRMLKVGLKLQPFSLGSPLTSGANTYVIDTDRFISILMLAFRLRVASQIGVDYSPTLERIVG
jgi:hypothetical protein